MNKKISLLLTFILLVILSLPVFAEAKPEEDGKEESLNALSGLEDISEEDVNSFLNALGSLFEEETPASITSKEMKFYLCKVEDTRSLPVYFIGESDVPYVSLEDWGEVYTYLLRTYVDRGSHPEYEVTFSIDGEKAALTRKDGDPYPMTVDCAADTITFYDFDAFVRLEADRMLIDILETDDAHSEDEKSLFRRTAGSYQRYGDEVVLDAGAYGIDFVSDGKACYMPLQTLSDVLLASKYVNVFYNGKEVFYVKYGDLHNPLTKELTPIGELFSSVEKGKISEAMAKFNYAELCLAFDTLYGLREVHGFRNFDDLAKRVGAREALMSTDPNVADTALYTIVKLHLDDLHSDWQRFSPFSDDGLQQYAEENIGLGRSDLSFQQQMVRFYRARMKAFPDGVPGYQEIGNTAYITFDSFAPIPDGVNYYETAPTAENTDTIGLLIYAYSQIMRENSPIENVVLDLSFNSGGDSDTAVFTLGAFLGDAYASVTNTLSGALATGVYNVDLNLDGKFDENDWGLRNKKRFCLISSNSFSCGNLVPNIFKNSHQVTLIGQTSGGGSCMVLPMTTVYGTFFQISGYSRLAFTKNGSFYDIDRGAEPDFPIAFPESYYDREALTETINNIR